MLGVTLLRLRRVAAGAFLGLAAATAAATAAEQSVADIREELTVLNRQIQEVREALVTTGPARGLPQSPATALQRVDQLEEALRRLTNRVDVLANDLDRVVRDASNRVDDIEFRLTELEGGDVSLLGGGGTQLGGGLSGGQPTIPPVANITEPWTALPPFPAAPGGGQPEAQLAVGERADYDAARAALDGGRHAEAAAKADAFLLAYPISPFSADVQQLKADALAAQGDWRGAARAYLDTFSGAPDAPTAPRALHGLAVSLGRLGQTEEACLTLAEVNLRYPGSNVASDVATTRQTIGCR